MSYNDLWDFAKNRNLYYNNNNDDDDDYVIYVKKPKKEIYKNKTRR